MTTLFITGIDTDIGKTYATGILARHLLSSGKSVITQKLIQTGVTAPIADDIRTHRTLMNVPLMDVDTDGTTCPLTFVKPASPHLSARLENRTINLDDITHATDKLNERFNIVLLEGAGGVLVPINDHILTLDYIATHDYPVIVVTSARLGSINHTLLTLEAIHARGLRLFAVVFNHHFDTDGDISADTLNFLQNHVRENYPTALFLRLDGGQIMAFDKVADRF
ncbi:dethiobiotin synthase [Moraxella sp.]|uniref:dethiobiotin synthase n=1 Tax=Moraxella sp. TaxID=479 RepID=UPI002629BB5F|nr:dethiobiotin synthase [Moraxella sp.]MCP3896281.1 ATP-dependent dethiobiotin synthetase BioD [Moraxella sp.]